MTVPQGVPAIENWTFARCRSLTGVTLYDGIERIGCYAFNECTALESIQIPVSVKRIEHYAFGNCNKLELIGYTGSQTEWNAIEKLKLWAWNLPRGLVIGLSGSKTG